MTLRISEMPCSFTGQALYSLWKNETLQTSSGYVESFGKFLVVTVYYFGTNILCAPAGVLYHTYSAAACKVRSYSASVPQDQQKQVALAWEHFKASAIDCTGLVLVPFRVIQLLTKGKEFVEISDETFIRWWFSASRTRFDNPPTVPTMWIYDPNPPHNSRLMNPVLTHWGEHLADPSTRPHDLLRFHALINPLVALNDAGVVSAAFFKEWQEAYDRSKFQADLRPKRPSFQASEYVLPKPQEKPAYTVPWKTIAWTIALVAVGILIAYAIRFFSSQPLLQILGQPNNYPGYAAPFVAAGLIFGQIIQTYTENRGTAEKALADRLIQEAADSITPARGKVLEALFWYKTAAARGHAPAQRFFGLGLLASLSMYHNTTLMDHRELMIVKEGMQWLQAAAINGDENALEDLRQIVNFPTGILNPQMRQRIYQGVIGNSDDARVRSMFVPGYHFTGVALQRYGEHLADTDKRRKLEDGFLATGRPVYMQIIRREIENAKPPALGNNEQLPPIINDLIAQYMVG